MVQGFRGNSSLTALLGVDTSGIPAIFPYHYRDVDARVPYPHLTLARFGNVGDQDKFGEVQEITTLHDSVRFVLCVWSTKSADELWPIYKIADGMLRGSGVNYQNSYFRGYRIHRTSCRDDLFDQDANAYHLHAEYRTQIEYTSVAQP